MGLQTKLKEEVLGFYRETISSYIHYLQLGVRHKGGGSGDATTAAVANGRSATINTTDVSNELLTANSDYSTIMVVLRLLRLLAKHGRAFSDLWHEEAKLCPAIAWLPILPQLFARAAHPDAFVQEQDPNP